MRAVGSRPFTPAVLEDLRERFFVAAREDKAAENLGAGIQGAMATAIDSLQAAGRDTVAYGRTLSAASGELGGSARHIVDPARRAGRRRTGWVSSANPQSNPPRTSK